MKRASQRITDLKREHENAMGALQMAAEVCRTVLVPQPAYKAVTVEFTFGARNDEVHVTLSTGNGSQRQTLDLTEAEAAALRDWLNVHLPPKS